MEVVFAFVENLKLNENYQTKRSFASNVINMLTYAVIGIFTSLVFWDFDTNLHLCIQFIRCLIVHVCICAR